LLQAFGTRLDGVLDQLSPLDFAFESLLALHQTAVFARILEDEGHEGSDVRVVARVVWVDQLAVPVNLKQLAHVSQSFN